MKRTKIDVWTRYLPKNTKGYDVRDAQSLASFSAERGAIPTEEEVIEMRRLAQDNTQRMQGYLPLVADGVVKQCTGRRRG